MIEKFKHKGLKLFFEKYDRRKLPPEMVDRIAEILFYLDTAFEIEDLGRPSFRLHRLKGNRKGQFAVDVQGPWRIVFRFEDGNAYDVNFEDYH